jgi:hypothetical protein
VFRKCGTGEFLCVQSVSYRGEINWTILSIFGTHFPKSIGIGELRYLIISDHFLK